MDLQNIKTIGVIGAGTMGMGIAQVASLAGFEVIVHDTNEVALSKFELGIKQNLQKGVDRGKLTSEQMEKALSLVGLQLAFKDLQADFFIEAVIENLEVKVDIFRKLEASNPESILATNTSSIPVTQIASGLENPYRLVGMHFFNPAHIMKLVEVISGVESDSEIVELTMKLAEKFGKAPVRVKDSPGFIVNRVARHYYVESLKILEERISGVQDIDRLLEASGFNMGPFRLMDLIGVDTNLSVTRTLYNQFHQDSKFRPSRIQQQMVDAGRYGKKSGSGFYKYN